MLSSVYESIAVQGDGDTDNHGRRVLYQDFNVFKRDKIDNAAFDRFLGWMGYVLTPELVRAARGLLGWSQHELASRAGLSVKTINRIEASAVPASAGVSEKLQTVFSSAGVQFIAANTEDGAVDGVGVRRRPLQPQLGIKIL